MTLIAEYNMKNRRRFITGDSVKTELIPYLELDGGVSLRFTVGNKKQYNLKDISDFVSCVAARRLQAVRRGSGAVPYSGEFYRRQQ